MMSILEGRVIGICGHKDTGKTAVVEGLVRFLKARGFTVGTAKHAHGAVAAPPEDTDSERHLAAGADCAVVAGGDRVQVNVRPAGGTALGAEAAAEAGEVLETLAARYLAACDCIVAEGFKRAEIPKIVVSREPGDVPEGLTQVVACVSDRPQPGGPPTFRPNEIEKLGVFLLDKGLLAPGGPTAHLVVNGRPVPMNEFVRGALSGVLAGFISSLRGVPDPTTIEISIRRR